MNFTIDPQPSPHVSFPPTITITAITIGIRAVSTRDGFSGMLDHLADAIFQDMSLDARADASLLKTGAIPVKE
jgi:hypothetical protein